MSAARLAALTAVTGLLLAPGTASAALGWHDGDPDDLVPESVKLNDVANHGTGPVIAVGRDTVTQTDGKTVQRPAIYRFWGERWHADTIGAPTDPPVAGELVEVAVNAAGAWAVGRSTDDDPLTPDAALVVKLSGSPTAGPIGPTAWTRVTAPVGIAARALSASGPAAG